MAPVGIDLSGAIAGVKQTAAALAAADGKLDGAKTEFTAAQKALDQGLSDDDQAIDDFNKSLDTLAEAITAARRVKNGTITTGQ
jgi:ABC-type transporter Mla subunit MlaD